MIPTRAESNEIVTTRFLEAPRELVYRVFTDPTHVSRWWGPQGFRTTTHAHDLRVGGEWRFTMHGPDGTDWPNRIRYAEIVPNERLAYDHDDGSDAADARRFKNLVTFAEAGRGTLVTMRARFASAEECEATKKFGAEQGGRDTLARLDGVVSEANGAKTDPEVLTISRMLDAPAELVYRVHTDPTHLARWFGPKGLSMVKCELDLRPGGTFHYGMATPDGNTMWGKWTFLEVTPGSRLVTVTSFSDASQGITRHPMAPDWPLEMLSTATFEDVGGKTRLTMRMSPLNALENERSMFAKSHSNMEQGWSGTFQALDAYLAEVSKG